MYSITREEFDDISTWDELIEICSDCGYSNLDNFLDEDTRDEYIWDEIVDYNGSWESLRCDLSNIPCGCDIYKQLNGLEFCGYNDDDELFNWYKETICENLEEDGYFEDSIEDLEDLDDSGKVECEKFGTEEFTINDLLM